MVENLNTVFMYLLSFNDTKNKINFFQLLYR